MELQTIKINVFYLSRFIRALFITAVHSRGNGYITICKDIKAKTLGM